MSKQKKTAPVVPPAVTATQQLQREIWKDTLKRVDDTAQHLHIPVDVLMRLALDAFCDLVEEDKTILLPLCLQQVRDPGEASA
jgi:hypothetical protein